MSESNVVEKHIAIVVDCSPSMGRKIEKDKTVMNVVNEEIGNFVKLFEKDSVCFSYHSVPCEKYTFDKISASSPVDAFSVYNKDLTSTYFSSTLNDIVKSFDPDDTFIVLITDGVLHPGESLTGLKNVCEHLKKYNCYAVGFYANTIDVLLDYFTGRQIISYLTQKEYKNRLTEVASLIETTDISCKQCGKQDVYSKITGIETVSVNNGA